MSAFKPRPAKDAKNRKPRSAIAQTPKEGRVFLEVSPNAPVYYVSHAEVSHTQHDIGLAFGLMPTRLSPADRETAMTTGELHIETMVQILIPPTLLPGLINALSIQKEKYEEMFGKINTFPVKLEKKAGKK